MLPHDLNPLQSLSSHKPKSRTQESKLSTLSCNSSADLTALLLHDLNPLQSFSSIGPDHMPKRLSRVLLAIISWITDFDEGILNWVPDHHHMIDGMWKAFGFQGTCVVSVSIIVVWDTVCSLSRQEVSKGSLAS